MIEFTATRFDSLKKGPAGFAELASNPRYEKCNGIMCSDKLPTIFYIDTTNESKH